MDKRTSMGIVGNLDAYMKFNAAEAMGAGDSALAASMGAGMGAGMGMAMAQQSAAAGPWGAAPAPAAAPAAMAPPPPPPPVEKVWHIAENGETKGPFSRATMGQMAGRGDLTRESLVWTAGQDGWKPADDVAELAQLFTILPPPPPPGA